MNKEEEQIKKCEFKCFDIWKEMREDYSDTLYHGGRVKGSVQENIRKMYEAYMECKDRCKPF